MCVNVTTNVKYRFKVLWQVSFYWKADHIGIRICAFMKYTWSTLNMKYRWLRHSPFGVCPRYAAKATSRHHALRRTQMFISLYLRISSKAIPARRPEWRNKGCLSVILPDQVEGDVKDTAYQIGGISSILSSPIHRGSPFFIKMRFPIRLGMTLWTRYYSMFFDRNDRRLKDTVYQIARIAFFIRMRFPIKLGMTVL
jgi:hypothetical protein